VSHGVRFSKLFCGHRLPRFNKRERDRERQRQRQRDRESDRLTLRSNDGIPIAVIEVDSIFPSPGVLLSQVRHIISQIAIPQSRRPGRRSRSIPQGPVPRSEPNYQKTSIPKHRSSGLSTVRRGQSCVLLTWVSRQEVARVRIAPIEEWLPSLVLVDDDLLKGSRPLQRHPLCCELQLRNHQQERDRETEGEAHLSTIEAAISSVQGQRIFFLDLCDCIESKAHGPQQRVRSIRLREARNRQSVP
jgi:hypothetical protein